MKKGNKGTKVEGDFPDEQSIFNFLGMKYKQPNERRDGRSVELVDKTPDAAMQVGPDMQDVGKTEAVGMAKPVALQVQEPLVEKKKVKAARKTVKKPPSSSPKDLIGRFKKEGLSFLKTLTEQELSSMIDKANQSYYGNDEPIMSDDQYDLLREYIMEKYPKNKVAKDGHVNLQMEAVKNKVKLPYEM